ncbi:DNA-3-methyladenine glycosylase family protein [Pedosphaera parvula]|uniref:DNA-3-methyladenine glycosylase II n=1 Tax=Pedosphaera parvula (strain Ellin514) TaxID=320771 RepID=B9XG01_PEDPL|nr:DNA-3-methyladenine glycosylase [Pedosphaera parvula]EEF61163.1 DNA-3-methyladenine glycosylase II [Pedosphaera parvula Ellin514]
MKVDKTLAALINRVGPCAWKPTKRRTPFEALVQSVAYQQLNGLAAATIFGRFKALYPKTRFPTPQAILETPDERLRTAGLSRAKVAAIKDIAAKTVEGIVPNSRSIARLDNSTIISQLTTIRGIGTWTVEMLLIFKLGRLDVLPTTDYAVRKGFAVTYGWNDLPKPAELLKHGEIWRPYRTVASWYLWRSLDIQVTL